MDKFSVYSLDPAGNQAKEVPVDREGGEQSFGIGAQHKTLWHIITR